MEGKNTSITLGRKWKKGIKKMERKIRENDKENGNECERVKEKGKMLSVENGSNETMGKKNKYRMRE